MSDVLYKAARLIEGRRVLLIVGRDAATVVGDTDIYTVTAAPSGMDCDCASRTDRCSHIVAAMVMFGERQAEEEELPF